VDKSVVVQTAVKALLANNKKAQAIAKMIG
jgi:hypothetical protein